MVSNPRYCAASWCRNSTANKNISFFRFPVQTSRCHSWLKYVRRLDLKEKDPKCLNKLLLLCAIHFTKQQFMNKKRKKLIWNAVPDIYETTGSICTKNGCKSPVLSPASPNNDNVCFSSPASSLTEYDVSVPSNTSLTSSNNNNESRLQRRRSQRRCTAPSYHCQYQSWSSSSNDESCSDENNNEPLDSFDTNSKEQIWNESEGSSVECIKNPTVIVVSSHKSTMNKEASDDNEKRKEYVDFVATEKIQCSICDKSFSQKGLLNAHLRIHGGSRPFICSICSKGFKSKDSMLRHQITHSGAKPFPCDICEQGFSSAVALREHKARHDKQNLYECNICGRGFRQNSCFRRHLTVHTNKKPYECNQCKKRFSRMVYLHSHMLTHTGDRRHTCQKCGKMFAHLSDLNRHKIIHTGKRPYKCAICEASFADPSSRRRHEHDHDGKKSFLCQSCGETFKRSTQLKSHFTKKHSGTSTGNNSVNNSLLQASETYITENIPQSNEQQSLEPLTVTNNQLIGETIISSDVTSQLSVIISNQVDGHKIAKRHEPAIEIVSSSYSQTVEKCIADSTVDSITSIPQMLDAIDPSITSENNSRYTTESSCNTRSAENHSINEATSHPEQIDYIIYPDFNSQEYYNWLSGFTSICKLLHFPIDIEIFTKISQVSKSIADVLASPSGILSNKENYKVLMNILSDLQEITTGHLNYVFDQLQN